MNVTRYSPESQDFKEGATPEDVWEGEIDAIGDSQ